jgi:type I restriction enzyme S subunit
LSDLPEGWASISVGQCADVLDGMRVPVNSEERSRRPGSVPYYGATGQVGWIDEHIFDEELCLVGEDGAPFLDKSKPIAYLINGKSWVNNHAHVLRAIDGLTSNLFLKYALDQTDFSERVNGSTRLKLTKSALVDIPIPLPPLSEQKRILAKVEALLAEVNAARERLEKVPAILKRFRQSVLAAACSGRLTEDWREAHPEAEPFRATLERIRATSNAVKVRRGVSTAVEMPETIAAMELPETWMAASAAELLLAGGLVDVKDGNHGSQHPKVSDFTPTGVPFITAAQVNNFSVDYDGAPKVSGAPLRRLRVGFAQPGDVLLTHKGTVGRTALNIQPCVLTPQTTYYRCRAGLIDPEYLVYCLASPQFYDQLATVMSQTTRDFVPISEQYNMFCLLPPFTEQRVVAERVKALLNYSDLIINHVAAATSRAQKIGQATLAKAFGGELVPTEAELARAEGRDYESAAQLLARVQAEREAQEPVTPAKKRKAKEATSGAHKRAKRRAATG